MRAGVAPPLASAVQCTDELAGPEGIRSLAARIVGGRPALYLEPGADESEAFGAAKALVRAR